MKEANFNCEIMVNMNVESVAACRWWLGAQKGPIKEDLWLQFRIPVGSGDGILVRCQDPFSLTNSTLCEASVDRWSHMLVVCACSSNSWWGFGFGGRTDEHESWSNSSPSFRRLSVSRKSSMWVRWIERLAVWGGVWSRAKRRMTRVMTTMMT